MYKLILLIFLLLTLEPTYYKDKAELLGLFTVTAYCPCIKCCGKNDGITASNKKAIENYTVAMDKQFTFGSIIFIDNKKYSVEDRGGKIKGNKIDIFMNDHKKALNYGVQKKWVKIRRGK